jgi:hypothetical protein
VLKIEKENKNRWDETFSHFKYSQRGKITVKFPLKGGREKSGTFSRFFCVSKKWRVERYNYIRHLVFSGASSHHFILCLHWQASPEPTPKKRRTVAASDDEEDDDEEAGGGGAWGDDAAPPSDEEEGEDLMDNAYADYEAIPELDQYDEGMLDKKTYADMDGGARVGVRQRGRQRGPHGVRIQGAL